MDRRTLLGLLGSASASGLLAACSHEDPAVTEPSTTATAVSTSTARQVEMVRGSFASRYRKGAQTPWLVVYPPGHRKGDKIPVLICLHGSGADENTPLILEFPENAARLRAEGFPAFACAGIGGGGDLSFYHARADGTDTGAMVSDEFVSVLQGLGLDLTRPALYGYSMGGVGAIYLAARAGKGLVSSVVAASTPFIPSFEESRGSYDSPDDFARNDIRTLWPKLAGIPVRVDIGTEDPFLQTNWAFLPKADPVPEFHLTTGGHNEDYWGRMALDQLRFVGEHFR